MIGTAAVLGAGDMGAAVAACLIGKGLTVTTYLTGRSSASRERAHASGMQDTDSLESLVATADILLSIIPPTSAIEFAETICPVIERSGNDVLFVDCNAVSPSTLDSLSAIASSHSVRFQDAGIVGAAPRLDRMPVRIYTSGAYNEVMKELTTELIDIRSIGDQPGKASALKMVYASLTKGTTALRVAAMLAGEKLGVGEEIRSEFRYSLPAVYEAIEKRLPDIASVAGRWTGEMREIASTFEGAGLPPAFHEGAEAIFDQLSRTPISGESRDEAAQGDRSMEQLLEIYLKALDDG